MKLSDEVKVSLVTAACILALAIMAKNVIKVELDFVSQYGPFWMYMAYIGTKEQKARCSTLFWSLAIILVTAAILAVYAL